MHALRTDLLAQLGDLSNLQLNEHPAGFVFSLQLMLDRLRKQSQSVVWHHGDMMAKVALSRDREIISCTSRKLGWLSCSLGS
jgi:hypothetical protein